MEHIILSLLLIKSMTVYEMKMFIQKCLSTVCSDSLGSIQSAVKKLISKDCITVKEYQEISMIKKEYSITEKGLTQFKDWIAQPMNLQKVKNMEEAKFFFLGMARKEIRMQSIQGYLTSLKSEQEKLLEIQTYVQSMKEKAIDINCERIAKEKELAEKLISVSGETTLKETVQNIYDFQIYNLEYGMKRIESDINFYQEILEREMDRK